MQALSDVTVSLRYLDDGLYITIHDNGVGFILEEALNRREGLGLQNILRRATLVGGKAEIMSKPGEGTTLQIQMSYG